MSARSEDRYEGISLDTFALTSILRLIDQARLQLVNARPDEPGFYAQMALLDLDMAWAYLPSRVRGRFPRRPSQGFDEVHAEHHKNDASEEGEEVRCTDDSCKFWLATSYVSTVAVDFITALDEVGLYIQGGSGFPAAMGDQPLRQKPPGDKKYPGALSREVGSDA